MAGIPLLPLLVMTQWRPEARWSDTITSQSTRKEVISLLRRFYYENHPLPGFLPIVWDVLIIEKYSSSLSEHFTSFAHGAPSSPMPSICSVRKLRRGVRRKVKFRRRGSNAEWIFLRTSHMHTQTHRVISKKNS